MNIIQKIQTYIERTKFDNFRYGMLTVEMIELAKIAHVSPADAVVYAYEYGVAKGYRAAKSELAARCK